MSSGEVWKKRVRRRPRLLRHQADVEVARVCRLRRIVRAHDPAGILIVAAQYRQAESGREQRLESLCRESPIVVRMRMERKGLMSMNEDAASFLQDRGDLMGGDPRIFDVLEDRARHDAVKAFLREVTRQLVNIGDQIDILARQVVHSGVLLGVRHPNAVTRALLAILAAGTEFDDRRVRDSRELLDELHDGGQVGWDIRLDPWRGNRGPCGWPGVPDESGDAVEEPAETPDHADRGPSRRKASVTASSPSVPPTYTPTPL